jgi:hypothetical protein
MDLSGILARSQERAESRMRDTCTVTVPSAASSALDPTTWLPTTGAATTVYSGKCRLRMGGTVAGSQAQDVVGTLVSTSTPTLSVPISAPRLPVGAVVLITDVPADDPAGHLRLGLRLRVVGQVLGTDMTAQRLTVEAVTG